MDNTTGAPTTFRFKFTPEFTNELFEFAQLHRYDNRAIFKEAWEEWTKENHNDIESEVKRLTSNGYTGSVLDKMYKSARYYFRKKKTITTEPKERRRYVNVDNEMIETMDDHIMEWSRRTNFKPATAFSDFCESHKSLLEKEVLRLYTEENLTTQEIPDKLKKTYKNRYFQRVKAPLLAA